MRILWAVRSLMSRRRAVGPPRRFDRSRGFSLRLAGRQAPGFAFDGGGVLAGADVAGFALAGPFSSGFFSGHPARAVHARAASPICAIIFMRASINKGLGCAKPLRPRGPVEKRRPNN